MRRIDATGAVPQDSPVQQILDTLPVTDRVFYDLRDSQPLVEQLTSLVRGLCPGGRILIVAPNALLAHALLDLGYRVDLWQVPQGSLTDDLHEHVRRRADLDALLADPAKSRYDIVILPFVLEAVTEHPAVILERLGRVLSTNGRLLVVFHPAGALGDRVLALRGRSAPGDPRLRRPGISLSWPSLPRLRTIDQEELAAWCRSSGLRVQASAAVLDRRPWVPVKAMGLGAFLAAGVAHALKLAVPGLRDAVVATIAPITARASLTPGEHPRVTVVVSSLDHTRLPGLLRALAQQSYPSELIDVIVLQPKGAPRPADPQPEGVAARVIACAVPNGPAAANRALQLAAGEVVVFTDDLCRLAPGWIEAGVSALASGFAAVAGIVNVDRESEGPFLDLPAARPLTRDEGIFPAANGFYLKAAAIAAGGFDETFESAGRPRWGWDTQLGERIRTAGYATHFEETAYVFRTFPFRPRRQWMAEEFRRAVDIPAGVRRSPALRGLLVHRCFASRRTFAFDLMLAGLLLTAVRRRPRYLALGLPLARMLGHYFDLWPPSAWRPSFRHVRGIGARHAVWLSGLIAGSIKARRIVL